MQCKPTWHDPNLVRPRATTAWLREVALAVTRKEVNSSVRAFSHTHNLLTADTFFRFYQFYALHSGEALCFITPFHF